MSSQEITIIKAADHTKTISPKLISLLTELIRASHPQAPPPPPSPDNKMNKKILHELQSLTSEIRSIRSDLQSVKAQTDCERKAAQKKLINGNNLLDLLDLQLSDSDGSDDSDDSDNSDNSEIMPLEKNNKIARRYNSELRRPYDFIAPLYNPRGNHVFGFPTTVSDLLYLDDTAEKLLCGAFGLKYESDSNIFIKFCGFDPDVLFDLDCPETCGRELVATRVVNRHKRATDLQAAGKPRVSTRKAAARHNAEARRHNACADDCDYEIMPIHDERNLPVPGFPTEYSWFYRPHQRDVLYFLREYGQDVEPEGCLQRFEAFVGIPISKRGDPEKMVQWHL